jgi:type VI secretion system secreted protein Hcp
MAAFDYFLRIDGVTGESTDDKHKGEIDVESFSWGESHPPSPHAGSGGGKGKVQIEDLHISARTTKASPQLLIACAAGTHFKSAVLTGRRSGGKAQADFLTFSLSDVLVTDYHVTGTEAEPPRDAVSLSFGKIEVEYKEQKADGSLGASTKVGWDVKKNQQF